MAGTTLEKGKIIYTSGQPMTALHLITDGKVLARYPGGAYQLARGDVIGISEICFEVHFMEYCVAEDATVLTYPFASVDVLSDLLQKHPDVAKFFLLSACRQISIIQNRCALSAMDCSNLYGSLQETLERYKRICASYRMTPRTPIHLEELNAFLGDENPDLWLNDFYLGLSRVYKSASAKELLAEPTVTLGILRKCSLDFRKTWLGVEEQFRYLQQLSSAYFNEDGDGLFDSLTSLYAKLDANAEERPELFDDINRIIGQFQKFNTVPKELLDNRIQQFRDSLADTAPAAAAEERPVDAALPKELVDSLNTILDFAGEHYEQADDFRKHISAYRMLEDRNSMEDDACRLRRLLTDEFYPLYRALFIRSMQTKEVPAAVRMFLIFGYVDEVLAGTANTLTLYELLTGMVDNTAAGLYTLYDWLVAIAHGKKEPSRNEFEQDYTEYIHKQKATGNITDAELKRLEKDAMSKVDYELQNMFQTVNKISFGRVTLFCPVFTAENALKDLKSAFVTVSKTSRAIEQVRKVDYSAFFRPTMDTENSNIMGKEPIHKEYLPDIILMPNAGIRGVMWQEIEGKRRNTPARMMFSIFYLEDLTASFLHMAGEFRWEMCRRIQGARWNDLSERSLTSEYFDYVQFYRKNRDLSAEAKERVRTGLQRAKNSYKEMFVRDYIIWILFEGNASPRLNKVARKILFTYCPFSANIRSMIEQNPLYGELLHQHKLHSAQNVHRLDTLRKKLQNAGTPIPAVLEEERKYYLL